jgi:hypothetical protein
MQVEKLFETFFTSKVGATPNNRIGKIDINLIPNLFLPWYFLIKQANRRYLREKYPPMIDSSNSGFKFTTLIKANAIAIFLILPLGILECIKSSDVKNPVKIKGARL